MMTVPLSQDLRRRLVRAVEAGCSGRDVARRFEVSASLGYVIAEGGRRSGMENRAA